jgi:hypothetical protein
MSEGKTESTEPEIQKKEPQAPIPAPASPLMLRRPDEEPEGIATQVLSGLRTGRTSAPDAAILLKILNDIDEDKWRRQQREREEKEERERLRSQANDGSKREEDPEIAKIKADLKILLERQQAEAQEKHDRELIEKATALERERIKNLEEKISSLSSLMLAKPDGVPEQKAKSELQTLKETAQTIRDTAQLMGMKDASSIQPASANITTSSGAVFEGIPVTGGIPAYLAAIPIVIEKVVEQIDKLATKYLGPLQKEEEEPMITLPPKPEPEPQPKEETPQKPEPPVQQEKIPEEMLKMPEKPEESKPEESKPEESKPEEELKPQPAIETALPPVEVKNFSLAVGPPKIEEKAEATKKEYKCKYCGQGGFKKTVELALHAKKCPSRPRKPKKEIPKDEEEDVAKSFKTADELITDLKNPET